MKESDKCIVSVIIPVYKVEKYLKRCVDSIINQTYRYIEVILVNDGSPDSCGEICDQYAKFDSRVIVIHKDNGGLSDARNYGIGIAEGQYILFVDSDDYIELDAIEKMISNAKEGNLDIVCADAYRSIANNSDSIINKTILVGGVSSGKVMTGEDYLVDCIHKRKFSVAVWTRMYRTKLIKENNIYFIKGLLHEDENWTPKVMLSAKRVGYFSFAFYNYVIRDNSITQTANRKKHILDVLKTCTELETEYDRRVISIKNKKILKDYLVRLYINTSTFGEYDKDFYKSKIDKKFIFRNSYLLKTRIETVIYSFSISLYRYIKVKFS